MYTNEKSWLQLQDLAQQYGFDLRQEPSEILSGCNYFVLCSQNKVLAREPAGSKGLIKIHNALESLQNVPYYARSGNGKQLHRLLGNAKQQMHSAYRFLSAIPRQQQTRAIANTALQLFLHNYQRTGEDCYRAQSYTINLQAKDTYRVIDSQGEILLNFKANNSKVEQILDKNNLSSFHYVDFARAQSLVTGAGVEAISSQARQRIIQLGNLAPANDKELLQTARTQQVATTVKNFLNSMGTFQWSAPDGNYSYELAKNGDLKISSNLDGRKEILNITKNGVSSKLAAKDFIYFAELKIELADFVNQQKQPAIASNTNTLSALLSAQKVMDLLAVSSYQDSHYKFIKQGQTIVISSKDGKGELARLENNEVTGNLTSQDLVYFQDLQRLTKSYTQPELAAEHNKNNLSQELER